MVLLISLAIAVGLVFSFGNACLNWCVSGFGWFYWFGD